MLAERLVCVRDGEREAEVLTHGVDQIDTVVVVRANASEAEGSAFGNWPFRRRHV